MKKTKFFLCVALLFTTFAFAQDSGSVESAIVGKYTVKIITNNDNTYGYEISENSSVVEKETQKRFFSLSSGYIIKGNALIVGKWYAGELLEGRNNKYALGLPKARELGVTEDDLTFKPSN